MCILVWLYACMHVHSYWMQLKAATVTAAAISFWHICCYAQMMHLMWHVGWCKACRVKCNVQYIVYMYMSMSIYSVNSLTDAYIEFYAYTCLSVCLYVICRGASRHSPNDFYLRTKIHPHTYRYVLFMLVSSEFGES